MPAAFFGSVAARGVYQRVSSVTRSVRGSTGWKCRSATGVVSPGNRLS
jgi:hypothetical protein